ncbi:hypothetical protein Sango_0180600 [Sesamum angolense]|uniref:Uncharacterized protein n=1 Tax=Sesamum angolense TaxID=2727404 RepID=A0AAE1XGM5_9LAMI|nr:hypothetical protein Sango_0180600 [Sesamum angolense]
MANDDDFTFCRVGPPVDGFEAQRVADNINEIHIDEKNTKAASKDVVDGTSETRIDNGNANAADSSDQNGGSLWKVGASSYKQGTVGSLAFNVVDASRRKEVDQQPKQAGKRLQEVLIRLHQKRRLLRGSLHPERRFLLRRVIVRWTGLSLLGHTLT